MTSLSRRGSPWSSMVAGISSLASLEGLEISKLSRNLNVSVITAHFSAHKLFVATITISFKVPSVFMKSSVISEESSLNKIPFTLKSFVLIKKFEAYELGVVDG